MSLRRRPAVLAAGLLVGAVVLCDVILLSLDGGRSHPAAAETRRIEVDLRAPSRMPKLSEAASKPTAAGATAFTLFWFDALNYSLAHLDTDLLASHTGAGCRQCTGYLIALQQWKESRTKLEGGLTVPLDLAIGPFSTTTPVTLSATFLTTPATVTEANGTTADYPGGRTRGGVTVLWTDDRWQLTDFVLDVKQAVPGP